MLKDYYLREMTAEDGADVAKIELECFSLPWSEEALIASLQQNYSYFVVACTDESIIGYGGVYVVAGEAEIINIAVKSEYRGKGVGKELVMALLQEAKKRDAKNTFLEVRESNINAIALYEKCGFKKNGIRKNFYEKPVENAVIMWKKEQ